MGLIEKFRRHGAMGSVKKVLNKIKRRSGYIKSKFRDAPVYANPTEIELAVIENGLQALGIEVHDYAPPPQNSKPIWPKPGFLPTTTVD